jgi:deoxyribodipyrimidine photo-lyase
MTRPLPTREEGLRHLGGFVPFAGRDYAERRNYVPGTVSSLSPYVRHRLLTEEEITGAVLQRHSYEAAEKFLQEVCWRTYWKGWLEMRPGIWLHYLEDLEALRERMDAETDFLGRVQAAESGETGIECLDDWVKELCETGYLHNHVRMWFASIWIHTLRLPWQLGADFFLRHLLDGDAASNTLSWRWVCGLQTPGKVYVASAENIERYTEGRYAPFGLLATETPPIPTDHSIPKPQLLPARETHLPGQKTVLLVTEEDLSPESWCVPKADVSGVILIDTADATTGISSNVTTFKREALESTKERLVASGYSSVTLLSMSMGTIETMVTQCENVIKLLQAQHVGGTSTISIMGAPIGPTQQIMDSLLSLLKQEGVAVRRLRRDWDDALWPHATHGFFRFKEQIPIVLRRFA